MMPSMFKPRLFSLPKPLDRAQVFQDLSAGLIVGIIAIPLSLALAIASGVRPEVGLVTAVIAGFLISFLGGSRVQIGGPTGAFVIIVYGIIAQHGMVGLVLATFMAGIILVILGLSGLGSMIKFIPYPIVTGFTAGIAIVILSTQIKDFFGLQMGAVPSEFIEKLMVYAEHLGTANLAALGIGVLSLAVLFLWPRVNRKIPGALIVLVLSTIIVAVFKLEVETIGSRYGDLSLRFAVPGLPRFDLQLLQSLIGPAITIALLGGIESLLCAVVSDGMIGDKHDSNTELVAQGVANMASALFGGLPATGAIARTAANVRNGGRSPLAGITHAVVILVAGLALMPLVGRVPLAAMASILIMVAYNMGDWQAIRELFRAPKTDIAVLLVTLLLTVFVDLVVAIQVGMALAAVMFMKRMADVTSVEAKTFLDDGQRLDGLDASAHEGQNYFIYEINGPFFFGAADTFLDTVVKAGVHHDNLILLLRSVPAMDATAYQALLALRDQCRHKRTRLILADLRPQPLKMLEKYRFFDHKDHRNDHELVANSLDEALQFCRDYPPLDRKSS
jgi:SulP family sulfate permease